MNVSKKRGIATLPIMLVVGMMSLAIVVSITSVAFNELLISQVASQSEKALSYAEGGARDALIRITRNKNYTTTSYYTLDFVTNGCSTGDGCAQISVSSGNGETGTPKIIISKGISKTSARTMQVSVTLDEGTNDASLKVGKITSSTWSEIIN